MPALRLVSLIIFTVVSLGLIDVVAAASMCRCWGDSESARACCCESDSQADDAPALQPLCCCRVPAVAHRNTVRLLEVPNQSKPDHACSQVKRIDVRARAYAALPPSSRLHARPWAETRPPIFIRDCSLLI